MSDWTGWTTVKEKKNKSVYTTTRENAKKYPQKLIEKALD
jgi:hypothetical protein